MESDAYAQKCMSFTFHATELTAKVLAAKLKELLKKLLKGNAGKLFDGEQTLKQIERYKRQLTSVDVPDSNLKSLKHQFAEFKVDYSLMRDKNTGEYTVFFKAQDSDRIERALEKVTKNLEKDSVLDKLQNIVQSQAGKAIEHIKEPAMPVR